MLVDAYPVNRMINYIDHDWVLSDRLQACQVSARFLLIGSTLSITIENSGYILTYHEGKC